MPTKLGQNFLINKTIAQKIVAAADLNADDFVLEIGPGKGILTEELAGCAGKAVAVEIDKELSNLLSNKFSNAGNFKIINEDILKIDLSKLICTYFDCHSERARRAEESNQIRSLGKLGMTECSYKVIANLPYYITSPVIRMFLEAEYPPQEMILMVQKEVAERIVAKPGKMSILAVSVQYYAEPEILFYVGKENFEPVPKVDSAVIRIKTQEHKNIRIKEQTKKFFRIVKAGFCAKRKTLANNLTNSFYMDKRIIGEKLKAAGILSTVRAQELSINDWKKLSELF
jgi:16S rRNA (adenine1518-N6/adenine1519-N6)-dimethyltransferase